MTLILLTILLSCPKTEFKNKTNDPWNDTDYKHAEIARERCGQIYKNSPCMKIFIKRTVDRDYSVICGKSND